jgi:DNA-binding SARP family transcriptional activator
MGLPNQSDNEEYSLPGELITFPLGKNLLPEAPKSKPAFSSITNLPPTSPSAPILICLLGDFRVYKEDKSVDIPGAKAEAFLCGLAIQHNFRIPRDIILESLWPEHPPSLAGQSLNSLVYNLHKSFGDALQGSSPVCYQDGYYFLNKEAGVGVDIAIFESIVQAGNQQLAYQNRAAAVEYYQQAIQIYRGDLCTDKEVNAKVERERLRAHFLTALSHVADFYFSIQEYTRCLEHTERILQVDPCREDAHRLAMCCYVRQGERAQALRQFRLCEFVLRAEFDAAPEPRTVQLYDLLRLSPESI